jgi:hypothetical protein
MVVKTLTIVHATVVNQNENGYYQLDVKNAVFGHQIAVAIVM